MDKSVSKKAKQRLRSLAARPGSFLSGANTVPIGPRMSESTVGSFADQPYRRLFHRSPAR
jgi:hypothetical protein